MKIKVIFILVFTLKINNCESAGNTTQEQPFPPFGYNNKESGEHGRSKYINLTMVIESIFSIDVSRMEYVLSGYVVQEWKDKRLSHLIDHPILISDKSLIWLPDLYCVNCRISSLNDERNRNIVIRVHPDGSIYYSQLAQLHASCFMKLQRFPFDAQECPLVFASYGYTTEFITYFWNSTPTMHQMQLEQFTVSERVTAESSSLDYKAGKGNFTVLTLKVFFTRQMGFYILHVYTPCAVLVCLSWMMFYMEAADIGDRLSIGVTLILTMIFLLGYINQSLPKVSYIKAVDWYVIVSLGMIVGSVLESVFVYWLLHQKKNKRKEEHAIECFDSYIAQRICESSTMLPNLRQQLNGQRSMPSLPTSTPNINTLRKTSCFTSASEISQYPHEHDILLENRKTNRNILKNRKSYQNGNSTILEEPNQQENDINIVEHQMSTESKGLQNMDLIAKFDYIMRYVFPLTYLIFNVAYVKIYVF